MEVRTVRVDELDRLRDIRLRALLDAPGAFGGRYEEEVEREAESWRPWVTEGAAFVAESDTGWIGLVSMRFLRHDPGVCDLLSMWVDPSARGHGLSRLLLDAGVAWARDRGASTVLLGVVEGNDVARGLYEQAGFLPTGETEPLRSDATRTIVFLSLVLRPGAPVPRILG